MTHLHVSQIVRVPLERAFQVFSQFEAFPEFMTSVERVRRDDADPNRIFWIFSLASMLRQYTTDVQVDLGRRRISWSSVSGPDHTGQAQLRDDGQGGTELTLDVQFHPSGTVEHLGDKLGLIQHRLRHDLIQFARYAESDGHDSPTGRRVAATATPDDRPSTLSERLSDRLLGAPDRPHQHQHPSGPANDRRSDTP